MESQGRGKGILNTIYIKAAAKMLFLGFVATARTKGKPICGGAQG